MIGRWWEEEGKQKGQEKEKHTVLSVPNALWQSGDMGEKCNKKVVNFGN